MQCTLALHAVRYALRSCSAQLEAAVAGAGGAGAAGPADPNHTAADGSVTAALAEACAHIWGGEAAVYVPTRLRERVVEKSANRELAPAHPHDAVIPLELLLQHLVADVRSACANKPAWFERWLPHMSAHVYETRVCRGRACAAAGVRPTCERMEGSLPLITVHVPRDDGSPTDLATLLARLAAPERRGVDPICNGASCALCPAPGARCPCPTQMCPGKVAGHILQPCELGRLNPESE